MQLNNICAVYEMIKYLQFHTGDFMLNNVLWLDRG